MKLNRRRGEEYLGIKSFESLFVGGFKWSDVDAVRSRGALVGDGGDSVTLGGDPNGEASNVTVASS